MLHSLQRRAATPILLAYPAMPMESSELSTFCGAALYSGLLSKQQLDDILHTAGEAVPGPMLLPEQLEDKQIAQTAVDLGYLNVWQAEQLKAGRTKFTLGPYQVIDSIGRGGMGHVFKAEHSMLGRIEACKVLPKSKTTPDSIATFHREIRAQAQLDHPNLVRLSYAGQDGATYFFVTEYVPGADLRQLVRQRGMLSAPAAATIISQAAQGLAYAHANHLVHRDIKPGNLLVTPDGRTKLTDLGLAGFLHEDDLAQDDPSAGKIVGTADYLAPETIVAPSDIRAVSDIYSLGCTLYYAVTGKVPFPGGSTADKLRRHQEEAPLNPQRFNPDLDDAFLEVLSKMMGKDPAKRLQTAQEVIQQLAPWTLDAVPSAAVSEDRVANTNGPPFPAPRSLDDIMLADTPSHFLDSSELSASSTVSPSTDHSQPTVRISWANQETSSLDEGKVVEIRFRLPLTVAGVGAILVPLLLLAALVITGIVLATVIGY